MQDDKSKHVAVMICVIVTGCTIISASRAKNAFRCHITHTHIHTDIGCVYFVHSHIPRHPYGSAPPPNPE